MTHFEKTSVKGVELELWCSGKGRPVLFLHGGDGVEPHLPFLTSLATGYSVIAPSHPGFGGSDLPRQMTSVDDLAYLYLDFIEQLGLSDIIVIGSSFGGWVAAEVATKNLTSISALVLCGAMGFKFMGEQTREITDLFSIPQYKISQVLYAGKHVSDYSQLEDVDLIRMARNHHSFALFGWSPTLFNPKLRGRLHRITVPTLVVWGDQDQVVAPDYGRRLAETIPQAEFSLIEGAGHYVQVENPDEFRTKFDRFVSALPSAAA